MKVFVFGDSFSVNYSSGTIIPTGNEYIKWKGYEPKTYPILLSEHFNADLTNLAYGGYDNDSIFYSFIKEYPNIQENDLVVFGWSDVTRFSYTKINSSQWYLSTCTDDDEYVKKNLMMRQNKLHVERLFNLIDFIDKILIKQKVIHWKWGTNLENSIQNETNMEVKDGHYNELGQRLLFERMVKELETSDKIRLDLDNLNFG